MTFQNLFFFPCDLTLTLTGYLGVPQLPKTNDLSTGIIVTREGRGCTTKTLS